MTKGQIKARSIVDWVCCHNNSAIWRPTKEAVKKIEYRTRIELEEQKQEAEAEALLFAFALCVVVDVTSINVFSSEFNCTL